MREVLGRTKRPSRWMWVLPVSQVPQVVIHGSEVLAGDRGVSLVILVLSTLTVVAGTALMTIDLSAGLVLTDDELVVERRRRPRRIPRADVVAVDGNIPGRPDWSESVVLTVREAGTDREVRIGNLDTHARVLIPRLREWAGVGAEPGPPGAAGPGSPAT